MNALVQRVTVPTDPRRRPWGWVTGIFVFVLAAQGWLVARAGTDVPFQDQWDVEGKWFYPAWVDGTWRAADLFRAHNEHRIGWTHLLNLGLFAANGQWDPLVQMMAGAILRAVAASIVAWWLTRNLAGLRRAGIAVGVALAFLPVLAWHNALWGFQSQVYFCELFSVLALGLLAGVEISWRRRIAGFVAGGAAVLAMGAGAFVPVAWLGILALRVVEGGRLPRVPWTDVGAAVVLLGFAWSLRVEVPEHAALRAQSVAQFLGTLMRVLAWPHVDQPLAAVALNLPLMLAVGGRVLRKRRAVEGEDFAVLLGGWALAASIGAAWARGGSDEFAVGVPSRYADFFILLPVANAWCVGALMGDISERRRTVARWLAVAWVGFLGIGWLGLSAQMARGVVIPRVRDREAPIRLVREFQRTGDARVFEGQPRLLVPHPNAESVRVVLADPRMRGRLPPSLQPDQPMGFWSRAVRWLLGQ